MENSDWFWIVVVPTACLFKPCPDIALAAGYSFSQLEIPQDESLYIAQSDIKDYFYSLGLPEDLQAFFSLPPLSRSELLQAGIASEALPAVDQIFPTFIKNLFWILGSIQKSWHIKW